MEEKGITLMKDGEKALKKFSLFGGSEAKHENARECFLAAATQFKATANWVKAGSAFERAADMSMKLDSELDYIQDVQDAAMMLRKTNDKRSGVLLTRVIDLYDKQGKYINAAKFCVTMAESNDISPEEQLQLYKRGADYYKNSNSKATAQELVQKIADVHIKLGNYTEAKHTYQKIASECLDDRMMRGMARKYFFMALLCELATIDLASVDCGIDALRERFDHYCNDDNQFSEHTREHMLITGILSALEATDMDAYEAAVEDFDSIIPLDSIKMKMLLKGKQLLRAQENNLK